MNRNTRFLGFLLVFLSIPLLAKAQNQGPRVTEKTMVGTISLFWQGGGVEPPAFRFHTEAGDEMVIAAGKSEQFGGTGEYLYKEILDGYMGTPSAAKKSIVWEVTCTEKYYKSADFYTYDLISLKKRK